MLPLAARFSLTELLIALRAFSRAAAETRGSWQPGLPLELALVEAARPRAEAPTDRSPAPAAAPKVVPPKPRPSSPQGVATTGTGAPSAPGPAANPQQASANPQTILLDRWKDVLKAAYRRDPRAQALLNSCKPLGIEKGRVVLAFSSDLLREKMEKGHSLSCVQEALQEVIGEPLGVRCILSREPALKQAAREPDTSRPTEPVEEGGMVATAIRDLGAQVMDVKPLPPEGNA